MIPPFIIYESNRYFFLSLAVFFILSSISVMKSDLKTPVAVGLALGIYFGIGLFIFAITARSF